ncbi:MAG: hypothetical protein TREMPRED_000241 [Tremellales sp. Tagirdzhanova-0007]|nr:MAG: hypothetical protein TREMPRED_000241 [Tremellales sp. Tagirdzhanova-0007]
MPAEGGGELTDMPRGQQVLSLSMRIDFADNRVFLLDGDVPKNNDDLASRSANDPERRNQLKKRSQVNWHLRSPDQGPGSLALKNHFIAMTGEYVGTVLFMIFALGGTNVANIPTTSVTGGTTAGQSGTAAATANTSNLLYISLSFGFSLAVNAWIFFRVSGGLFNPAVSLGMVLVGALTPIRGALLTFAQILGGITGAAIIQAITPGTLNVRTELGGGTSVVQGLFIEMFLTSLLMLAILLLAAEKNKATFIAPIGIGLALFVAELLGVYYTGGSLNPARSFGPSVVLHEFSHYHWIYWLGPLMGATLAAGFYKMLKVLQYETVLGPETDTPSPQPSPTDDSNGPSGQPDVEKGMGKGKGGKSFSVSGPGLADLHTDGNKEGVFDLEKSPGPVETRLDRIESLLGQLISKKNGNGSGGKIATSPQAPSRAATKGSPQQLPAQGPPQGSRTTLVEDYGRERQSSRTEEPSRERRSKEYTRDRSREPASPIKSAGQHTPFTYGVAGVTQLSLQHLSNKIERNTVYMSDFGKKIGQE